MSEVRQPGAAEYDARESARRLDEMAATRGVSLGELLFGSFGKALADAQRPAAREAEGVRQAQLAARFEDAPESAKSYAHASDCAVFNAPALEPGPCDCGAENQPPKDPQ